jgi:hypothetical protein
MVASLLWLLLLLLSRAVLERLETNKRPTVIVAVVVAVAIDDEWWRPFSFENVMRFLKNDSMDALSVLPRVFASELFVSLLLTIVDCLIGGCVVTVRSVPSCTVLVSF